MAIITIWVEFNTPEQAQNVLGSLARYITPESASVISGVTNDHGIHNPSCIELTLCRPDLEVETALQKILNVLGPALGARRISRNNTELWPAA